MRSTRGCGKRQEPSVTIRRWCALAKAKMSKNTKEDVLKNRWGWGDLLHFVCITLKRILVSKIANKQQQKL